MSLFFLIGISSYSQPRTDEKKGTYKIDVQKSLAVTNIDGWCYDNSYGKWAGYKNTILNQFKNGNNKKTLFASVSDMSWDATENILSMQFKKIYVNEHKYYALYTTRWRYWYTYPAIHEDIHHYKLTEIFLFTEDNYRKLFDLHDGINSIPIYECSSYGIGYDNDKRCRYKTEKDFYTYFCNNENLVRKFYKFFVKKEDDTTIRFQQPGKYYEMSEFENGTVGRKYDDYMDMFHTCNFKKSYFEINIASWNRLKI